MPSLLEKIEANAALRLTMPPGRLPAQELARYKNFLKVETHRLKILHRAGAGGRDICRARAAVFDLMLRSLWDAARSSLSAQAQKEFPPLALVAIGGYGRAELNPQSDIDFMFLHAGQIIAGTKAHPYLRRMMDGILYPLWDIGIKFGHSVRTVAEAIDAANSKTDARSMETKTSLIEARLIVGDKKLFEKFQGAVLSKCVEDFVDQYLAARVEDQAARRGRFGNSAAMQEPNIKNGCGGLRDFQNLHWMAFFKHRTRTLEEMEGKELISATERKQLETAYDFLLSVRTELHYTAGKAVDVLGKSVQPVVAHNLGYTERAPSRRLEHFMGDFYLHSRNIYLITRTLEERLALLPQPQRLASFRNLIRNPLKRAAVPQTVDGFRFVNGQIHAASPRVFRDQPRRLLRVFLYAQQRACRLHPDLAQLIRSELALVNRGFLHDPHVRESFLEIINQRGVVAPVLRAMHEVGLLGKYIPEFGKLTCLVQHEFYHQYTADEHTLVCLEKLDRCWESREASLQNYAELFRHIERPFVLYLALLLHDSGKADPGDNHAEASGRLALRVAKRLGLDGETAHALRILIENHLTMAQVAQRRDLEDAAVIRHFAALVQNVPNLIMLTLHTLADTQATSDKLWNGFKDSLHWMLYHKTHTVLAGGTDFLRAEEKQRELQAEQVARLLPRSIEDEEWQAHFSGLPPRYFQIHPAEEIADDIRLVHQFIRNQMNEEEKALEPVLAWENEPDRGYSRVKVCTWDRAGLFSKIAGSLSSAGINILSAQIFTRADGVVLDTFFVTDARSGTLVPKEERDKCESILFKALTGEAPDFHALIARQKLGRPLYQSLEGDRIPTRISFDNQASETRTLIEVETEDRVGVLYEISRVFAELDVDIALAKISTEKGAAIDTFYAGELDGQKITAPERHQFIEKSLRVALAALASD